MFIKTVVPHNVMLTSANVSTLPHRVQLYAGGNRKAAKLRPKPPAHVPVPVAASASNINAGASSDTGVATMRKTSSVKFLVPDKQEKDSSADYEAETETENAYKTKEKDRFIENNGDDDDEDEDEDEWGDGKGGRDTLSELPVLSQPFRRRSSGGNGSGSSGGGVEVGNSCFNDIVNANTRSTVEVNNDFLSTYGATATINNGSSEDYADEVGSGGTASGSSSGSSDDSDDSSEYGGEVKHVFSSTDLDMLMRTGNSPNSTIDSSPPAVLANKSAPILTNAIPTLSSANLSHNVTDSNLHLHAISSVVKDYSRAASNTSVLTATTAASGVSGLTRHSSGNGSLLASATRDEGDRRVVAIDLIKLDRSLFRNVLPIGAANGTNSAAPTSSSSFGNRHALGGGTGAAFGPTPSEASRNNGITVNTGNGGGTRKCSMRQLVASLAVALAAAKCEEEDFSRKFGVPVEEAFTYTTDTKVFDLFLVMLLVNLLLICSNINVYQIQYLRIVLQGLELLNDLLFSRQPGYQGFGHTDDYIRAFERVASTFRQNSMLDTSQSIFLVCVHVQSTVISATDALFLKQQFAGTRSNGTTAAGATNTVPRHGGHSAARAIMQKTANAAAAKIAHSHIRLGVSYSTVSGKHSLVNTLPILAFSACNALTTRPHDMAGGSTGMLHGGQGYGGEDETEREPASPQASTIRAFSTNSNFSTTFSSEPSGLGTTTTTAAITESIGRIPVTPLPLKLKYIDHFAEYCPPVTRPQLGFTSGSIERVESDGSKGEDNAGHFSRDRYDDDDDQDEQLYELYLGTNPELKYGAGSKSNKSVREDMRASSGVDSNAGSFSSQKKSTTAHVPSLCEPIDRSLGLCDFSLSEVICSLSTRLVLQILMLVLVDRPVMLLSTSSTLLSKVQLAIPRLIWPFRIHNTHSVRQILSAGELHRFVYRHDVPFGSESQQPVIREKKLDRKLSSWREVITRFANNVGSAFSSSSGARSPRGSFTRQRKSASDLLSGVLVRNGSSSSTDNPDSGANSPFPQLELQISTSAAAPMISPHQPRGNLPRIITPPSLLPSPKNRMNQHHQQHHAQQQHHHHHYHAGLEHASSTSSATGGAASSAASSTTEIDQHSCILGVLSSAFYAAAPELREELDNLRIRGSGFTIIDIDTGIVRVSAGVVNFLKLWLEIYTVFLNNVPWYSLILLLFSIFLVDDLYAESNA